MRQNVVNMYEYMPPGVGPEGDTKLSLHLVLWWDYMCGVIVRSSTRIYRGPDA